MSVAAAATATIASPPAINTILFVIVRPGIRLSANTVLVDCKMAERT
jgi:hypothetical protein